MKLKGIVLAGGKSSRFGEDKALTHLNGMTFLERAIHRLKELRLEPTIITNQWRDYSFLGCPIYRDWVENQGPLGGLYTAFQIFKGSSLLVLTCDMPFVTGDSLLILVKYHTSKVKVTIFELEKGQYQPFPGIYESSLSHLVGQAMEKGVLSIQSFLAGIPEKKVIAHQRSSRLFLNVNTKEDLWNRV